MPTALPSSCPNALAILAVALATGVAHADDCSSHPILPLARCPIGGGANTFAVGDLDADGDADMIVPTSGSSSVKVCLNNGDGTFAPATTAINRSVKSIALGDVDADGDLDAVACDNDNVYVFFNNGSGAFPVQTTVVIALPSSFDLSELRLGDLDNDDDLDIAVGALSIFESGPVHTLFNNGAGAFPVSVENPDLTGFSVRLADVDGDKDLDVTALGQSGVRVALNNGSGDLASPTLYAYPISAGAFDVADFDNDSHSDLAVVEPDSESVLIRLNDGAGVFGPAAPVNVGGPCRSIHATDFTGDGLADLVVGCFAAGGAEISIATVPNFGKAAFGGPRSMPLINNARVIRSADFDGDGDLDIAVASAEANGGVDVLTNLGGGDTPRRSVYPTSESPYDVELADLDVDGDLDVVVAAGGANVVTTYFNKGNGTLSRGADFSVPQWPRFLAAGDLDGDGDPDIVVSTFDGRFVSTLFNLGDGLFGNRVDYPATRPTGVALADIDNDGDLDVAAADGVVRVWRNNGSGALGSSATYPGGTSLWDLTFADFDHDGDVDIAAVDAGLPARLRVLSNDGGGVFSSSTLYTAPRGGNAVRAADLDGDGDIDIVTGNLTDEVLSVRLNNGDGSFAPRVEYAAPDANLWSLALADLECDGDLDIIISSSLVYTNNGAGAFSAVRGFAVDPGAVHVAAGDLDNDGDSEIISVNRSLGTLNVLENRGLYAPSATTPPQTIVTCPGRSVTLNARATGSRPLTYQWRRDGVDIPGAASDTLTLVAAVPADAGAYTVVVANSCADVTIAAASLAFVGAADWNADGAINSTDVSDFINTWFADHAKGTFAADFNHDGVVNSADVSDFINAWFVDTAVGC